MKERSLSNGWRIGSIVSDQDLYQDPPMPKDRRSINIYAWSEQDQEYRVHTIPSNTPVSEIITYFKVGSKSEPSYGDDPEETMKIVSKIATAIADIIPYRVTFADWAGLKLRFLRQVTLEDVEKIYALFPADKEGQAGLERYFGEWDGESHLLAPILKENLIHFWWD